MKTTSDHLLSRTAGNLRQTLLVAGLSIMLTACGGGKDSERDPGGNRNQEELGGSIANARNIDVGAFETNLWQELRSSEKGCGSCHRSQANSAQEPYFADDDVNVAYDIVIAGLAVKSAPESSKLAIKVGPPTESFNQHNCWSEPAACKTEMAAMIQAWADGYVKGTDSREVALKPIKEEDQKTLGDEILFPPGLPMEAETAYGELHQTLTQYCADCHRLNGVRQTQRPFFASADINESYDEAKLKIDLNSPASSDLVSRLKNQHNCWDNCLSDAATMQTLIENLAAALKPLNIKLDEEQILISRVLGLLDGVPGSGGNRYEVDQIALYEFKKGSGDLVEDTSLTQPKLNLRLYGQEGRDYRWLSNWGVEFLTPQGRAQGETENSKKLHDLIKPSGQYSIEAWVIPGNITQEDANIISYSWNGEQRNATLGQNMYSYEFFHRSSTTGAGDDTTVLSTPNNAEVLQPTLQHVVVTYAPLNGRRIYVNGQLIDVSDPEGQNGDLLNWHSSYALVLGNDVDGNRPWQGTVRMVAIHDRALTPEQIDKNYSAEVGQKYLMPFAVSHIAGMPAESYIVFEVSQYDEFSYLFHAPRYVNLAGLTPDNVELSGMRIGMNGDEVRVGQAYSNVSISNLNTNYSEEEGSPISSIDTIIELQNGADIDQFFLTFETLGEGTRDLAFDENDADPVGDRPGLPTVSEDNMVADIGVRTFDEINSTMAKMSRITDWENVPAINNRNETPEQKLGTYVLFRQQFPAVENAVSFLPSHQMAIAQLAMAYCDERVKRDVALPANNPNRYFKDLDFSLNASAAITPATIHLIVDPLLQHVFNVSDLNSDNTPNLASQPLVSEVRDEIRKLILDGEVFSYTPEELDPELNNNDRIAMTQVACMQPEANPSCDNAQRTEQIVKAACTAALGSAAMLVQ